MALGLFAQIGLVAHLYSLLVPALGVYGAGLAMSGATSAAIIGRTVVGRWMSPGADRRGVAALNYAMQAIGCAALIAGAGEQVPMLLLGTLLVGLGIGNSTSLPPLIAQIEFSREQSGRAVAQVVASAQATYAFAPAAFGLVREWTAVPGSGAAPVLYMIAMSAYVLGALAYLVGRQQFARR